MSRSRSISARAPAFRLREASAHRESIVELASSFAASFTDPAPIAQEALARDLAELEEPEGQEEEEEVFEDESDAEAEAEPAPYLYRRPSGIAFGTSRPALAIGPIDDTPLSKVEKKQSREAERSLLRDNHLLPPKHPIVKKQGLFRHLYRKIFSTKVPRPGPDEEATPEGHAPERRPSERSPLLRPVESPTSAAVHDHLNEQWEAAVAAGQIKTTWQREAKTIAVYSRSLITTFLLQYSISITSIFAVGRIGKLELGAVSCKLQADRSYLFPSLLFSPVLFSLCVYISIYLSIYIYTSAPMLTGAHQWPP